MRIDKAGMASPSGGSTKARRLQPGFAVPPEDDGVAVSVAPEQLQAASEAAPASLVSLSGMEQMAQVDLALDQKAAGQASALLQAMGGLQVAVLGGASHEARQRVQDLARALPGATDPGLEAVLRGIAQRAAVELAKPFNPDSK